MLETVRNVPDVQNFRSYFVAGGYQCVRLYDIVSQNNNPTVTYDGILKNVTSLGSHVDFSFMFTTGEDGSARIWDPRDSRGWCRENFTRILLLIPLLILIFLHSFILILYVLSCYMQN